MMAASDWIEAVKAVPGILWVVFAVFVVLLFRRAIAERLPGLRSIELPGGVKAQFDAALTVASQQRDTSVPRDARSRLERRIARNAELVRGSSILWVDDDHASTRPEREAMGGARRHDRDGLIEQRRRAAAEKQRLLRRRPL